MRRACAIWAIALIRILSSPHKIQNAGQSADGCKCTGVTRMLNDEEIMRRLQETLLARIEGGDACGPFRAAIVDAEGKIVAEETNGVVKTNCSHAHAEMQTIAAAEKLLGSWNLAGRGLTLYTTAEPCMMCVGGILWCGVERVVYGVGTEDVEAIAGFDEGFKPNWREEFARRGISVVGPVLPELGRRVLAAYRARQGVVYSPQRT